MCLGGPSEAPGRLAEGSQRHRQRGARDAPSIGLQKVVISTSSTQSNVLSGFLSASMMKSRSVDATSAFCTHEQRTGSASSAAVWTFASEA